MTAERRRRYNVRMRANQKDELLWPVTKVVLWVSGIIFIIDRLVCMILQ